MLHLLKRHLVPIRAHFDFVLSLTYAVQPEVLSKFLPPGLLIDEWNGMGFFAAAFVQASQLRPVFLPAFAGGKYFFGGYRVFCRYTTIEGRELRGLRIIRSDTDKSSMVALGNLLAHYNYQPARIDIQRNAGEIRLRIMSHDGKGEVDLTADTGHRADFLPEGSPFSNASEARHFTGPMPYTFAYEPETRAIIRVQGIHRGWKPRLIPVSVKQLSFFDAEAFIPEKPVLASCFYMEDVDYYWKRGLREQLARGD